MSKKNKEAPKKPLESAVSKEPEEQKELTASQLFDRYMRAVGRANKLADKLKVEILEAERLSTELAERYGVHVGKKSPASKTSPHRKQPTARDPASSGPEQEPEQGGDYQPPAQIHSEAPRLSAKESQDVAEIRRDSGLSAEETADAEALEVAGGPGKMAELGRVMGGRPVIPSPGEVTGVPDGAPDPGSDNQGGGTVEQKPLPEKE